MNQQNKMLCIFELRYLHMYHEEYLYIHMCNYYYKHLPIYILDCNLSMNTNILLYNLLIMESKHHLYNRQKCVRAIK